MSEKKAGPDTRQLREEKLPRGVFPGDQPQDFRIHLAPEVHAEIWKHAAEDTGIEVCGVLVGTWQTDERGPFVSVTALIRGEAATNKLAEVTFTHETWAKINTEMDARFRDCAIVGWYHTHPDFGIFLSDRDRFIHEHFFAGPGQVAYVVDPIRKLEGMFLWAEGKPRLCPFYWVGAQPHRGESEEGADTRARSADALSRHAPSEPTSAPGTSPGQTPVALWITGLALALCTFCVGDLLATRQASTNFRAIAEFALLKSSRIGLRERLSTVEASLALEEAQLALLEQHHQQFATGSPEGERIRQAWEALRAQHADTRQALGSINDQFGLSQAQTQVMTRLLEERLVATPDEKPARPEPARPVLPPESLLGAERAPSTAAPSLEAPPALGTAPSTPTTPPSSPPAARTAPVPATPPNSPPAAGKAPSIPATPPNSPLAAGTAPVTVTPPKPAPETGQPPRPVVTPPPAEAKPHTQDADAAH